jgi:monoterpene epsilon-lactone hydrolase
MESERPDLVRAGEILAVMRPDPGVPDTVAALRSRYERLCSCFPVAAGVSVAWPCLRPAGSAVVRASRQSGPGHAILFVHGGGGVFGSARGYLGWAGRLAMATGALVLVAEYRLAPEHQFPAGMDDLHQAWTWLRDQGFGPDQIALYGDSAGGGMAIGAAVRIRDELGEQPAAVVAVSAVTDRVGYGETFDTNARLDKVVSRAGTARTRALYLGDAPGDHPWSSPVLADLTGLAPVLLQVGVDEALLSDSIRFDEAGRDQAVETRLSVYDSVFHAWPMFDFLPESAEAIAEAADFLAACWRSDATLGSIG